MRRRHRTLDCDRVRLTPSVWFWLALMVLAPTHYWVTCRSEWFRSPPKPMGDGSDYENLAYHLAQGQGFMLDYADVNWQYPYRIDQHNYSLLLSSTQRVKATGRPPLLPLLISGVYVTIGRDPTSFAMVRLILATSLAAAGAFSVYLTAKLLAPRCASWETLVGCLATLAFAITHRTLFEYATDFLTEPIALLVMQLLVLSAWRASEASRVGQISDLRSYVPTLVAGALMGVLIMTRSVFVVWLPGVWVLMFASCSGGFRNRWRNAWLFVSVAIVVCLPWWIRNMVVLERAMPLGTQGPITMLGGYANESLHSNGDWQLEPIVRLQAELAKTESYQRLTDDTQREIMLAAEASRQVRQWIASNWTYIPRLMLKRIYVHWNPYTGRSGFWKLAIVVGIVACIAQRQPIAWWLVGTLVISTGVTSALYSTGGRFLVPLYGILYTLAGLGVAAAYHWVARACRLHAR